MNTREELFKAITAAALSHPDELTYAGYIDTCGTLWREPDLGYGTVLCLLQESDPLLFLERTAKLLGREVTFRRRAFTPVHLNIWLVPRDRKGE